MSSFKIFNSQNEMTLSKKWNGVTNVTHEIKFVNEKGQGVDSNWNGRKYRPIIIERNFSCLERIGRGFLGVVALCLSLGLAIFSKTIQQFFTKKKETLRFGIRVLDETNAEKIPVSKIKSIAIGKFCMQSSPCQHDCILHLTDGDEKFIRFDAIEIKKLIQKNPEKIRNTWGDNHFLGQDSENWPPRPILIFD